jgi:hypothetical protein
MPPRAVDQFQDALGELAAKSGEATDRLINRISVLSPGEARAFITDAYPALLTPFLAASGDLTAQWYAEQPTVPVRAGAAEFVPVRAPLAAGEQLAISGRWALTQTSPVTALQGSATRQVMNVSRDTVILNAARENVRWVRQAKSNACGFCKMLATRAAKSIERYGYSSEGVRLDKETGDYITVVVGRRGRGGSPLRGKRKLGSKYHDACRCIAVPVRDRNYEPPDYVQEWTDQYDAIVAREGTGDLLKISNLMDVGRVRPDRIPKPLQDGADLFAAATAADDAAAAAPVDLDTPARAKLRDYDEVEKEFTAAVEAGDDAAVDRLADELEAIDAAQRKAAELAAKAKARREAAQRDKWDRVGALVDDGVDPLEAESEVFGRSVESLRRRDFIAQARSEGHRGAGFDELLTNVYTSAIQELYIQAENATRGTIFNRATMNRYGGVGPDPLRLWTASESTARAWMSEEMAAWFDQNGRLTKSALRQSILDGSGVWRDPMTQDFNL